MMPEKEELTLSQKPPSLLAKYRSQELQRSLRGIVSGLPIALVLNGALLIGLVQLGKGVAVRSEEETPIEIIVTDVEPVKEEVVEPDPPIVEPPKIVAAPPPERIAVQPPEATPTSPTPKSQPKDLQPKEAITPPKPEPVAKSPGSPLAKPTKNFLPALPANIPGEKGDSPGPAEETSDGDTETPANASSGSTFGSGSGTSSFANRIRGLLGASGKAPQGQGQSTAALSPPPPLPPPINLNNSKARFGCLTCEKPQFPSGAKEKGIQGEARVSVDVDSSGKVIGVRLLSSSGHPELDQAAIEQARRWRFTPSEGGKQGVSARVDFQIEGTEYQRQSQQKQRQREEERRQRERKLAPPPPETAQELPRQNNLPENLPLASPPEVAPKSNPPPEAPPPPAPPEVAPKSNPPLEAPPPPIVESSGE